MTNALAVALSSRVRTEVVIIGAGPSGLLLSELLARASVDCVVLETRSRDYVEGRIRAGILEASTVDVLDSLGLGDRLHREGAEHRGISLQWPGERHHLDFVDLVGRSVWVYGQTEVTKDLGCAAAQAGRDVRYSVTDTTLHDLDTDRPWVRCRDSDGRDLRIDAAVVAGCDGSYGPSRRALLDGAARTWTRTYPYSWLGILADVAPSADELIYARHPDGFALHSMRSESVSRLYLQVPPDTSIEQWSDEQIWAALATRLGDGENGWHLTSGPITDKSVLPMTSLVMATMRQGRLFLAGDAAHIVPPTGAKGLNLAVADVALLAPALAALLRHGDATLADSYSRNAMRRVWRCTHFSWWMTTMLHSGGDPFDEELALAQLNWIVTSTAGATGLAENYAGLRIGL